MKPRTIRFIILLMSFSLAGIVCVQIFWIMHAVKINEEHFNRNVNEALDELVSKIETNETCRIITTNNCSNNSEEVDLNDASYIIPDIMSDLGLHVPAKKIIVFPKLSLNASCSSGRTKTCNNIEVCNETNAKTGEGTIKTTFTIEDDATKTIRIKMVDTNKIDSKIEKFRDVVEKMIVEYEIKNIPLRTRLELMDFQKLLKTVLSKHAIDLPYEYQVKSKDNIDTANSSAGYNDLHKGYIYKVNLFPNDLVEKSDYLTLYFPGKNSYIFKALLFMIIGSVVFTLIILITFIITIFAIIRQKKIADIKNDFINNMTHEFKTPIATISLASDSISSPIVLEDKELIRYFSGIIKQESKRMNTNVERVLQLSLLDRNDKKIIHSRIQVHDMIETSIEKIRLQLDQKNGRITTSLQADNCHIEADEEHFIGALLNILDNAIKYSPENPVINISTYNRDQFIYIEISDKGTGIAKEDIKKIFDRFYRVHTGNVHNVKGFGLGLSYVKEIITALKGNVSVQSQKGEGSTFKISIPYTK